MEQGLRESAQTDSDWNWRFRVLKAEILLFQGKSGEVLNTLAATLPANLAHGEIAVQAKAIEGSARASKEYEKANQLFHEAEELASSVAPRLLCEVAYFEGNAAFNRGKSAGADNELRRQQYLLADQDYQRALQWAGQCQEPFREVGALIGISLTSEYQGRFDEAIARSFKALDFAHNHQYFLAENVALTDLAQNYSDLGDLKKAIFYFSEELKVIDRLDQPKLKEAVFNNLGDAYFADSNYSKARESHLKALAIAQKLDPNNSGMEKLAKIDALTAIVTIDLEENQLDDVERRYRESLAVDSNDPRVSLTSAKIAVSHGSWADAKSQLQKILSDKNSVEFIRWDAELEMATILAAEHQTSPAQRAFQHLLEEFEAARSSVHEVENRLAFFSHAAHFYNEYVSFLVATGRAKEAFQVAEFSRARTLSEGVGMAAPIHPADIRIEKLQGILNADHKFILAYWLAPKQSFLWLVSASHFQLNKLPPRSEIEQRIQSYNKILLGPNNPQALEKEGQAIYQQLVSPVQNLIPQEAKLAIIPHGALTKLSFETLRVAQPAPHFWIEDVAIEMASSSSLLVHGKVQQSPAVQNCMLIIGNPKQVSSGYPILQYAPEEIERVKVRCSGKQVAVFSEDKAIPSVYRASHPERYRWIHFVTHGTASELSPLESAIILSSEGDNSFKLYARDIVKIPIHADLVTISACYGAGARSYSGEGLVGLAWAFLRAGAHQVVAALWEMDDRAAVRLMDDFYAELQRGEPASTALRRAKLKMIQSGDTFSRPYYWASPQLYTGW